MNSKTQKIIAASLLALMTVTAVGYKIYTSNKGVILSTASSQKTAEYDSIFKKDNVIDIKIDVAENDWKSMLTDPMAEEYKSANVTINGTTIKNVGFRTKGNLTLRSVAGSDSDRYSFRIKLDKYVDGQNLLGLDELVVNNMYSDPSYMREYLSYEALKSIGLDVPDTTYANIYINGKLYGFYLCVEAIDDSFLQKNFGSNTGNLYKQDQGSTLKYVEGSNYDKSELKVGNDEAKTGLKNFIKTLNEMPERQKGNIESVLDVDSALKYIAANTVLGNYDSYNGNNSHNYYLYEQNGKFTVIPWDYNMSMGGFSIGEGNATTVAIDKPVMGRNIENLPLIDNLLGVPEYKEKYHEYVSKLLNYLESAEKRVGELSTIIRPYVKADPTKFYTIEQFEENMKYTEAKAVDGTNSSKVTGTAQENAVKQKTSEAKTDGNTSASQNTNRVHLSEGQRPVNMPEGFNKDGNMPEPPEGFKDEDMPMPPQGAMGGDRKGGPNGGKGMTAGSIVNYIRDRVTNLKKQLSGELSTTGNANMTTNKTGVENK